jgi:hypothetical protein
VERGTTALSRAFVTIDFTVRLSLRDQRTTADYGNYFKNSQISQETAEARGLLARAKGNAGFQIARSGSEDLFGYTSREGLPTRRLKR